MLSAVSFNFANEDDTKDDKEDYAPVFGDPFVIYNKGVRAGKGKFC